MTVLSPAIVQKLQASGMLMSAIATDATEAFDRAEFIEATLDKWVADTKDKRPHCFIGNEQVDLESFAFGEHGKPNLTARMSLTRQIGEAAATERAKEWGLSGLNDYKTQGKRPGGDAAQKEKPKAENPWSKEGWNITRQGAVAKSDMALAQRLAKAANSYIGATRATA